MNMNPMQMLQEINRLRSQIRDPNQMIQQMMNSGRISQAQYDAAVRQAQQMMQMFTPSGHR